MKYANYNTELQLLRWRKMRGRLEGNDSMKFTTKCDKQHSPVESTAGKACGHNHMEKWVWLVY